MALSPTQRTYAMASFLVVPAVANALINGVLGWLTFGNEARVPMWGLESAIGPDLLGTCLFLPLVTCLIVTALTRRHVRGGQVDPLLPPEVPEWVGLAPGGPLARGLLLGLSSLVLAGGGAVAIFWILGIDALNLTPLLVFKIVFSVALGLVVTPIIGVAALADPAPLPQPA